MTGALDPQIRTYTGAYSATSLNSPSPRTTHDLRELAATTWRDLKQPAEVIVIPLEDYRIMLSDLAGQVITPHRKALLLTLSEPQKAAQPSGWRVQAKQWARALWYLGLAYCALCGLAQIAGQL